MSVWRVIVGVVVVVLVLAGVNAFFAGDDGEDFEEVTSDETALAVADAINRNPGVAFAVRGWVYDDGAFLQLCNGLIDGDPPRCRGPVLLLKNLDLRRLDLEEGDRDGTTVRYTAEPVVLGGTVDGTQLSVVEVLSG